MWSDTSNIISPYIT